MYACLCLHTLASPAPLVAAARAFTPRFEVLGSLVLLDLRGLARLFGCAEDLGHRLREAVAREAPAARVAMAATQTAAGLAALGRPGFTLIRPGCETAALAPLPVSVLEEYECVHAAVAGAAFEADRTPDASTVAAAMVGPEEGGAAYGTPGEARSGAGPRALAARGGWGHPRDTHEAHGAGRRWRARLAPRVRAAVRARAADRLAVLRRWGVHTLGALAALPAGDLAERLGPAGMRWQRLARGEDLRPLVPWVEEPPYEASLDLEWPVEGLEPLSFVLGQLLEPLAARLARERCGAAMIATALRLVSREAHVRLLQLPVPLGEARTLRTLVRLDLETHPPPAAVDRVTVRIEPAPARRIQYALFARPAPSPEHVATLVARLAALAGAGRVGAPGLVDTWRSGAFAVEAFQPDRAEPSTPGGPDVPDAPGGALRRYRLPVPARVRVVEGRPVQVVSDRRGLPGGTVVQAAGPWRAAGEWWQVGSRQPYDRDEWDAALADGTLYRLFVERATGQWFIEGVID